MENRFETFTYLVIKITKLIQRIKNIEMKEYGLKAVHVMCIYFLDKYKEGLTNKALVDLTLEDKAAISRALSLLKDKGLINYTGEYNSSITLTTEGLKVARFIEDKSNEAINQSSLDITSNERTILYNVLTKVERNLEEYYNNLLNE